MSSGANCNTVVNQMDSRQLWFTNPFEIEIREQQLDAPSSHHLLIRNLYSAVSAGTELLVFRGQLPENMALDANLTALANEDIAYPLRYGYACVGEIEQVGSDIDDSLIGEIVFSFQPHGSHFSCALNEVIPVPSGIDPKAAVFLANMETAVNLLHDGNPRIGSRVVVIGQGIVGLIVSSLLAKHPLSGVFALDSIDTRRIWAKNSGVDEVFSPQSEAELAELKERLQLSDDHGGADVVYELSGNPDALNVAIELCGYSGRIVVGSWYGAKSSKINLGGHFHRNRIEIISSQVSSIAPDLSGRWDKQRRFEVAWEMIKRCQPEQFITHCLPFDSAKEAYELLDNSPQEALQVVFEYEI